MVLEGKGGVVVSNDGATLLKKLDLAHPCAKMLVELSQAQDVEAGDGTTSVVVLCGSLLRACEDLLRKGIHPTTITEAFQECAGEAAHRLREKCAIAVDMEGEGGVEGGALTDAAVTSLSSKVVAHSSARLAPMAVQAALAVRKPTGEVDLRDIRTVAALGGVVEDSELLSDGMIFKQKASTSAGGPTRVTEARIALLQCHLSPPKTDMESTVSVSDYTQIDRAMRDERKYLVEMCRKIQTSGCNVVLIQKSILRDAVTPLSLDILAKMKIMVIKDIERSDVPFICKCLGVLPTSHIDHLNPKHFGHAALVAQETFPGGRVVRVSGVTSRAESGSSSFPSPRTACVYLRGGNQVMVEEVERSFHDALCVVRSIAKKNALVVGGAAAETEVAMGLSERAQRVGGITGYCMRAYAEAFEIIPYTLAENAGLNPIEIVTALRRAHKEGKVHYGINVRKGAITDMKEEKVVQPLLVTLSAIRLATECVCMILKIDDVLLTR